MGLTPLPRDLKPELRMFLTEEVTHWRCLSLEMSVTPSLEMSITGGGAFSAQHCERTPIAGEVSCVIAEGVPYPIADDIPHFFTEDIHHPIVE